MVQAAQQMQQNNPELFESMRQQATQFAGGAQQQQQQQGQGQGQGPSDSSSGSGGTEQNNKQ